MAIQQRFCVNHPERAAIGICVMTRKPICGECSTRYEGVNYSKEGLRLLQEQRAAVEGKSGTGKRIGRALIGWLLAPVMAYLVYLAYLMTAQILTNLLHPEM